MKVIWMLLTWSTQTIDVKEAAIAILPEGEESKKVLEKR